MTSNNKHSAKFDGCDSAADLRRIVTLLSPGHLALDGEHAKEDNDKRAAWGGIALLAYIDRTFAGGEGELLETMFSDLMSDLMHLADALGLDFNDVVKHGRRHYEPELTGDLA